MAPGPARGNTHGRIANPPGGVGQAAPDSPDRRVWCSGMMGIHHEDSKNTKHLSHSKGPGVIAGSSACTYRSPVLLWERETDWPPWCGQCASRGWEQLALRLFGADSVLSALDGKHPGRRRKLWRQVQTGVRVWYRSNRYDEDNTHRPCRSLRSADHRTGWAPIPRDASPAAG